MLFAVTHKTASNYLSTYHRKWCLTLVIFEFNNVLLCCELNSLSEAERHLNNTTLQDDIIKLIFSALCF